MFSSKNSWVTPCTFEEVKEQFDKLRLHYDLDTPLKWMHGNFIMPDNDDPKFGEESYGKGNSAWAILKKNSGYGDFSFETKNSFNDEGTMKDIDDYINREAYPGGNRYHLMHKGHLIAEEFWNCGFIRTAELFNYPNGMLVNIVPEVAFCNYAENKGGYGQEHYESMLRKLSDQDLNDKGNIKFDSIHYEVTPLYLNGIPSREYAPIMISLKAKVIPNDKNKYFFDASKLSFSVLVPNIQRDIPPVKYGDNEEQRLSWGKFKGE